MKEMKITNFDLIYDGMYFISWDNHKFRAFLQLDTILKMLEIEGLNFNDVNKTITEWKPLHFNRVTLFVNGTEKKGKLSLHTSDFSDEYLGKQNLAMIEIELAASGI